MAYRPPFKGEENILPVYPLAYIYENKELSI